MSSVAIRQEIHQVLDTLPPEVLPEVADFLDFLRFKADRRTGGHRVREAIGQYTAGEISLGRAAELAEMNYFCFEELLREQGIAAVEPAVTNGTERATQQEIADEVLA